MKHRSMTQHASLATIVLLLLFSGSVMAQHTVAPGRTDPIKRPNNRAAVTAVDPTVVRGLEAQAAATKHTGTNLVLPSSTGTSFAILLFADAGKKLPREAERSVDVGVIYIASGFDDVPVGYYMVQLSQQPSEPGLPGNLLHAITLDGPLGAGGTTQKRMHKPFVITKELDKIHFVPQGGYEALDPTTLGGTILNAVEGQFNKSKSNVKNN
ncbi:MAG: hypothetical protein QOJ64_2108 [Acidobacteriota bacterium]|nr:hypothetical protein [Acidobacteriota bacterium]